jgi:glycosyltransferase involved in cell wall biosynthesis
MRKGLTGKVIQYSATGKQFKVELKSGLVVEGVPAINHFMINFYFSKYMKEHADIIYFNELALSFPYVNGKSLVACHGVAWDIPYYFDSELVPDPKFVYYSKVLAFRQFHKFNYRYAVRKAQKILSVDSSLLRIVQHESPNLRDKITVIPNFADTRIFRPKDVTKFKQELLAKLGINESNRLILVPRNISFQRGIHLLVKIACSLPQGSTILLTGTFIAPFNGQKYLWYLKDKITANNLQNKLVMLGSIDHNLMSDLYNVADLVLIPSFFGEGTSLAAIEAMACKKVVIASNIGGLNDLIIDEFNGFLVPPDATAFIKKIRSSEFDNALLSKISENAFNFVNQGFSKVKWEKKIVEFFDV